MKEAGINISLFTAHSTQGAATSKAQAVGVPMTEILKAANWSSSDILLFLQQASLFGQSVLSNRQQTMGKLQTIATTDYVVGMYLESSKYNCRFLEDCRSDMGRMNFMRR